MRCFLYLLILYSSFLLASIDKAKSQEILKENKDKATEILSTLDSISQIPPQKKTKKRLDGDDPGWEYPHFFSSIIVPKSMRLVAGRLSNRPNTNILCVYFDGAGYVQRMVGMQEGFSALATQIGDLPQKEGEGYIHYLAKDNRTMISGIKSVSVRALSRYNEHYRRGADLRDIVRLFYRSFDHVFVEPKSPDRNWERQYVTDCANGFKPVKYPSVFMGTYKGYLERPYSYRFVGGAVLQIGFLQAPDRPTQKLQVTVTLQNGQVYKGVIKVAFDNALPREIGRYQIYR